MPVYNGSAWVESAVRSILDQSLTDLELILCDNASTDDSGAICQRLSSSDTRIRYYRHDRNIGANRNYQFALDQATGRYFKWASSSDQCEPTFLADCIAALESRSDAVLANGRTVLFAKTVEDGLVYDKDMAVLADDARDRFETLLTRLQLNNAFNGVIRTRDLQAAGPLGNFGQADVVLMADLALRGKFLLVDKPLFYRRMTPETATKLKGEQEAERHIEPEATRPLLWQAWMYHAHLIKAALRSKCGLWNQFRIVAYVLRMMIWDRRKLAADIAQAVGRRA